MIADGCLSISEIAKKAIGRRDWQTLEFAASKLCSEYPNEAETFFVTGVLARARGQYDEAQRSFEHGLTLAPERHDLAVELASLYGRMLRHGEALALLDKATSLLCGSPLYCDMAGSVLTSLGMPDRALLLAQRAHKLQPRWMFLQLIWLTV